MAGLLDAFNSDEGLLGLSLLAAAAPRAGGRMSIGEGLLGALQTVQQRKMMEEDRRQKAALQNAQIQHLMAQVEDAKAQGQLRQAQAAKMGSLLDNIKAWTSGQGELSGANADTLQATGNLAPTVANANVQSQAMQQRQQQNPLFGIPPQAIQADLAFNEGKGLSDMLFKRGVPNMEFINGLAVDKNRVQAGTSIPNVSQEGKASQIIPDATAPNGYRIIAPPGAIETYAGYARAGERAKSEADLKEVWDSAQQKMVLRPRSQVLDAAAPPTANKPLPGQFDPMEMARAEAISSGKPVEFNLGGRRGMINPTSGGDGPMAAGPSLREKASSEAISMGNQTFMKDSYAPALQAGDDANKTIIASQTARNALKNMGTSGWGTPTVAAAANVLGALGVPQAQRFATNAQQFQQAAMSWLWTVLNAAKGMQTEGDADRASQTFARLQNTPQANMFILDMTQSVAERERLKANYFREALPMAQKEGDLQRVEREWTRVAPSVWQMPLMKKWGLNE